MDKTLLSFAAFTVAAYVALWIFRPGVASEGLETTADMFVQALPWIVVSMLAAGLLSQFFHVHIVARWLGREAGIGGILLGAMFGMLGTGSRWAMYPLASGLLAANASPGAVFAFVTSWQLVSLPRLPAEVPFYGPEFAVVRMMVSIFIAVFGGILVNRIMQ